MTANYQTLIPNSPLHWTPPSNLQHLATRTQLPLNGAELGQAASTMPLALKKMDGTWQLIAVTGVQPDHNLFIQNGKWLGQYQPHALSTDGFQLQPIGSKLFLQFDTNSPLAARADALGAEAFFTPDGSYTDTVQTVLQQLQQQQARATQTQHAVQALVDAGVVTPWPSALVAQIGISIDGLHCIDEAALAALDDSTFLGLRRAQALGIAYGVNLSLQQCHLLLRLQRLNPAVEATSSSPTPTDASSLFDEGRDDTLRFNW